MLLLLLMMMLLFCRCMSQVRVQISGEAVFQSVRVLGATTKRWGGRGQARFREAQDVAALDAEGCHASGPGGPFPGNTSATLARYLPGQRTVKAVHDRNYDYTKNVIQWMSPFKVCHCKAPPFCGTLFSARTT